MSVIGRGNGDFTVLKDKGNINGNEGGKANEPFNYMSNVAYDDKKYKFKNKTRSNGKGRLWEYIFAVIVLTIVIMSFVTEWIGRQGG